MSTVSFLGTGETEHTRGPRRIEQALEQTAAKRSTSASSSFESDAVRVSERADKVRTLVTSLRALPEIRQDRVEDLQTIIRRGSYNPQSSDVADAITKAA